MKAPVILPFCNPMCHSAPLFLHGSAIVSVSSFALIFAGGWFSWWLVRWLFMVLLLIG